MYSLVRCATFDTSILPWRPGSPSAPSSPLSPFSPGGPVGPGGPLMGNLSWLACSGWPLGARQLSSIVQTPSSSSLDWSLWRCFLPLRSVFLGGDFAVEARSDVASRKSNTIRSINRLQNMCFIIATDWLGGNEQYSTVTVCWDTVFGVNCSDKRAYNADQSTRRLASVKLA